MHNCGREDLDSEVNWDIQIWNPGGPQARSCTSCALNRPSGDWLARMEWPVMAIGGKSEGKVFGLFRMPFWQNAAGKGGGGASSSTQQQHPPGPQVRGAGSSSVSSMAKSLLPTRRRLRLDPATKLFFPCEFFVHPLFLLVLRNYLKWERLFWCKVLILWVATLAVSLDSVYLFIYLLFIMNIHEFSRALGDDFWSKLNFVRRFLVFCLLSDPMKL